jgi:hypothetical protein
VRPEWTHVDAVFREGYRWVTDDVQPTKAVLDHFGDGTHAGGGLYISFMPNAYHKHKPWGAKRASRPHPRSVTIVCDLRYTKQVSGFEGGEYWHLSEEETKAAECDPFTEAEWAWLQERAKAAGFPIADTWNGAPFKSGSMRTTEGFAAPSFQKAAENYMDGCPRPGHSVFCGGFLRSAEEMKPENLAKLSKAERERMTCTWRQKFDLVVEANWPDVPLPMPAEPAPSIGNRNLDQVLAAIAAARPFLDDLGVHGNLVVPGRRGRVEEDEYVDEEGLAVAVPAELFTTLIEMARHTFEH